MHAGELRSGRALDLLRARYGERCAWTDGVRLEIHRGVSERRHLQPLLGATWLQATAEADDPLTLAKIDKVRRGLGGSRSLPMQHLGEAQAIHHAGSVEPGATFATTTATPTT